jgi:DNA-binding transcriptional MerR regulator
MFGHSKKNKGERGVPLEDIRRMASKGMGDKDIIKELKGRGYSYGEIEKAMLAAVKEGVNEPVQNEMPMADEFFAPAPTASMSAQNPAMQPSFDLPTFDEEQPDMSMEQSQALMEELIEGVIDDKWNKFHDKMDKLEENFDKIKAEIKQWEIRQEQNRRDSPTREIELRISELSEQLEDIDARVGGLEKAFKQFLPALTRNIESLSQLIHELREKQGMVEEEA